MNDGQRSSFAPLATVTACGSRDSSAACEEIDMGLPGGGLMAVSGVDRLVRVAALAILLSIAGCSGGGGGAAGDMAPVARSGQVDTTFGNSGSIVFAASEGFSDMAVAPDGAIYLTGRSIMKLDARGLIDASYGVAGRVPMTSLSPLLDASGNLYVISGPGVTKLDPEGRPVSSFGIDGHVTFATVNEFDVFERMARDPAGNIYVAGTVFGSFSSNIPKQIVVRKVDADGRLVTSFGTGGTAFVRTRFSPSVFAMTLDSRGGIYVAGLDVIVAVGAPAYMFTVKLGADGNLDSDFGQGGAWSSGECTSYQGVRSLTYTLSDQLIVGGECHTFPVPKATVLKLDSKGQPVTSFHDAGFDLFGRTVVGGFLVESVVVSDVLARQDGVIYAAGQRRGPGSCPDAAVAKLDGDGQFVPEFGVDGRTVLSGMNDVRAMDTDSAGRLSIGGFSFGTCPASVDQATFVVIRIGG